MLVLSRKKNESIVVNDAIVITVVEIRGDKVRLGIEAPREVPIHRSEVYAAIQAHGQVTLSPDSTELPAAPQNGDKATNHSEPAVVNGADSTPIATPR